MTGPPTASWAELSIDFGGSALPHGATVTIGCATPTAGPGAFLTGLVPVLGDLATGTLSNNHSIVAARLKIGPVATGPTYSVSLALAGAQGPNSAPPQCAALVEKTVTGVSGRFSGRFFWPVGVDESINTGGIMNPATVTAWQTLFSDLYLFMNSEDAVPHVFPAIGGDPREVTSFQVNGRTATQRRRNRR